MKGIDKGIIYILSLAAATSFAYLLITNSHFPYLGLSLSLIILSTLVYIFKKEKSRFTSLLYSLTLFFSFFIVFRVNGLLLLLNTIAAIFCGSLMAMPHSLDSDFSLIHFLISPFKTFFVSLATPNIYKFDLSRVIKMPKTIKQKHIYEGLKSLAISFIVLLIIIPLLASANPIFSNVVQKILGLFNLQKLFDALFSANHLTLLVRVWIFLFFALFIPKLLSFTNLGSQQFSKTLNLLRNFQLLIPKAIVAFVLLVFFITQAQLYFANNDTLASLGYTHSKYANEVFGQLSIVALIIFGLIYNDENRKKWSKFLTYGLIVECIFLIIIALKSDIDYSSLYGFTYKRLWGFTVVLWSFGIFAFFFYTYLKQLKHSMLTRGIILYSGIILVAVNVLNFDYLIYHYRKSTTGEGVDYQYLSELSSDAQSYDEQLRILVDKDESLKVQGNDQTVEFFRISQSGFNVIWAISMLQEKYKDVDIRTANFSEYTQYEKIKNIHVDEFREYFEVRPLPPYPIEEIKPSSPSSYTQ